MTEEPDRGEADPRVTATLDAYARGELTEHAALAVLARTRLLVPVVAIPGEPSTKAEPSTDTGDKHTEMALPKLIGNDGRQAIIAFTGLRTLAAWQRDARPVPAATQKVCQAAVAEDCAVVIDVAGPVQVELAGARLAALAEGNDAPPAHADPDVHAAVTAAVEASPGVAGFSLAPGERSDLVVTLRPDGTADASQVAADITARLSGRLKTIEIYASYPA